MGHDTKLFVTIVKMKPLTTKIIFYDKYNQILEVRSYRV